MESDLYHSFLRIGHLEINGVGYPLRYGKRGEGRIIHGMPLRPPPHPAPALGFLGAVIPSRDQRIPAGRKCHVLVEKHRLVPSRAQCQHATLRGAILSGCRHGDAIEGFWRSQLVNTGNGVIDTDILCPSFYVEYFLRHISGVVDGIVEIAVEARIVEIGLGDIVHGLCPDLQGKENGK